MNIYFVNRHSKIKGPFDIMDANRKRIIKIGDICLRDFVEGVAFLVVCSTENTWNACRRVGLGDNHDLSDIGNSILFSFDGLHGRTGNVALINKLSDRFREKAIVDFFTNAVCILEYKGDYFEASLFSQFFASTQELITRKEIPSPAKAITQEGYPTEFSKYFDDKLLKLLNLSINEGKGLRESYNLIREKHPDSFRTALIQFLRENPARTIYDKPTAGYSHREPTADFHAEPIKALAIETKDKEPVLETYFQEDVEYTKRIQPYQVSDYNIRDFGNLLKKYRKGDHKALEMLVKGNMRLVRMIANRYREQGVDIEDLVQEGTIGLMRALERYNPKRNVHFALYAKWWIHQAVIQALINYQTTVRLPVSQVTSYRKVRRCIEQYEQKYGYEPSESEIEQLLVIDSESASFLSRLPDNLSKLSTSYNDWDELPGNDSADDFLMSEARTNFIDTILGMLKKREAEIVRCRYGIGVKAESLSSIGERMGLTRERVRQISENAICKLQDIVVFGRKLNDAESSQHEHSLDSGKIVAQKDASPKPLTSRMSDLAKAEHKMSAVPYKKAEDDNIDIKKLEMVFSQKTTSYMYFWFMAIISTTKESRSLRISYKDILVRMIALAWPAVMKYKIYLGAQDKLHKYSLEILFKTSLMRTSVSRFVLNYLCSHYDDLRIDAMLSPLLNKVPYRFLSPWVKFTTTKDVVRTSQSSSFKGMYAIYSDGIELNPLWWNYIDTHYAHVCRVAIDSFNEYVRQVSKNRKIMNLTSISWSILLNP